MPEWVTAFSSSRAIVFVPLVLGDIPITGTAPGRVFFSILHQNVFQIPLPLGSPDNKSNTFLRLLVPTAILTFSQKFRSQVGSTSSITKWLLSSRSQSTPMLRAPTLGKWPWCSKNSMSNTRRSSLPYPT